MIRIIETNISININNGEFIDHQSRVIEVESWEEYIDEIKTAKVVVRDAFLGSMSGASIPSDSTIENFIYDNRHLSCDVIRRNIKSKKLAYVIK